MKAETCSVNLLDKEISKESSETVKIPLVNPEDLKYDEFVENYLQANQPVVFSNRLTAEWNSVKQWVTPEGSINFTCLQNSYGHLTVTVTEMKSKMSMNYGGMDCQDMLLAEFLDYWKGYISDSYPSDKPCLYLKDWHIMLNPQDGDEPKQPYKTPEFFSSDWLNETCEGDDFKFVYMGPKGSWTPFHADVYGSYSWSANVIGKKKWRLYPPGKEKRFLQANNFLQYDFDNPGVETQDYVDITQNSGEVIFVPSGWHHIVWNETDTISINHNWFNAANVCHVWRQLHQGNLEVVKELSDLNECDNFFEQCQLVLRANHGMNYEMFVQILAKVFEIRKNAFVTGESMKEKLIKYDIQAVRHVLGHLAQDAEMKLILNKPCFLDLMNILHEN